LLATSLQGFLHVSCGDKRGFVTDVTATKEGSVVTDLAMIPRSHLKATGPRKGNWRFLTTDVTDSADRA